jgi:hypothetical protein
VWPLFRQYLHGALPNLPAWMQVCGALASFSRNATTTRCGRIGAGAEKGTGT